MVFEGLVKVTAVPAIFISSALIIIYKDFIEGLIFLGVAISLYIFLSLIFHEIELNKMKKERYQE